MQNNRVYSAASITDVINLLRQYRLSGILTIRPASHPYEEEARINVELGQPVQLRQGAHEERFTNAAFTRLQSWGMIYFTFYALEPTLKLPPPQHSQPMQPSSIPSTPHEPYPPHVSHVSHVSHIPHTPAPATAVQAPASRVQPRSSPVVTQPLPAISSQMVPDQAGSYNTHPADNNRARRQDTLLPGTQADQNAPPDYSSTLLFNEPLPRLALEMAIASLTPRGKSYPIAQIPRYDRMIYLLINGRRTIADLTQLTKRPVEEVCNSLYRLKQQDLIVIRL